MQGHHRPTVRTLVLAVIAAAVVRIGVANGVKSMRRAVTCIGGSMLLSLAGCMNMPTPPSDVPTPLFSTAPYESMDCSRLAAEQERLSTAERDLTVAQEKRVTASGGHALFYGWGRGDGMETVELAKVRGERDAVRRTQVKKGCVDVRGRSQESINVA